MLDLSAEFASARIMQESYLDREMNRGPAHDWLVLARRQEVIAPERETEEPFYTRAQSVDGTNHVTILVRVIEIIDDDLLECFLEGSNDGQQWLTLKQLISAGAEGAYYGATWQVPLTYFRIRSHLTGETGNVAVISIKFYLSNQ